MSIPPTHHEPILKLDANRNVIQNSYGDMAFQGEYSGSNLIYRGFARPGASTSDTVWQIAKLTYAGSNLTEIQWPQNALGKPSSDFDFAWSARAGYTYI